MMRYTKRFLLCVLALWALLLCAGAEQAKVITPGGVANMRRDAAKKAPLVEQVPNGASVEVEEAGDEWTRVTYKNKHGYMQNEYLRFPSSAVGKTLYSNGGPLCVRESAADGSAILALLPPDVPVTVQEVSDGKALIAYDSGQGYVAYADLDSQNEAPAGKTTYIPMEGFMLSGHEMFHEARLDAPVALTLERGDQVTVLPFDETWALVQKDNATGYVPTAMVQLIGPTDRESVAAPDGGAKPLAADKAQAKAEKALKKQFKAFNAKALTCIYDYCPEGIAGYPVPLYRFTYISDQGQYRYIAYLEAAKGDALFCGDYTVFPYEVLARSRFLSPVQDGLKLTLDRDITFPGQEVRITAHHDAADAYIYRLYRNGKLISVELPVPYETAYFRPRESGVYRLEVTALNAQEVQAVAEASIWVAEGTGDKDFTVVETLAESLAPYSQQDGWWLGQKYTKRSNLQVSGCAIFTLSHALQLLGHTEESALPQNLAVTYAACLVEGGTLNASLIGRAAKEFNYATLPDLIHDKGEIIDRFGRGAVFSFSIVKGHIALAAALGEDQSKVLIIDSAPAATFERMEEGNSIYYMAEDGTFHAAKDPMEMPEAKYYPETGGFNGMAYYLDLDYVAQRGVRLIQPKAQ